MNRDRYIGIGLIVVLAVALFILGSNVGNLNQDDQLINRGQQVTNCIGDRQDLIDQWRAVATAEFVIQADRSQNGLPIRTSLALTAERAIYDLVDEKQEIRATQLELIEGDDPEADFDCPPVDDDLLPPPVSQ